jgi:tetraacyldisaccharide 4'-kinase
LVSGGKAGFASALVRFFLGIAGWAYSVVIRMRNLLYDKDLLKSYAVTQAGLKTSDRAQASIPVISVGNITVGGTGKTPMVIWLCNLLRTKQIKCAILTRGYKADGGENDEPAILVKNCPDAALIVNPDRVAGAIEAVKRHHAQVLVMDDGFQHRRLHRDMDIVTIDATLPFGFNRILPAGLLREPVSALKRAHAAALTRCDLVSKENLAQLTETISRINPDMVVSKAAHAPVCAISAGDKSIQLGQLKGRKIFAFCGIANPDAFIATLSRLGVNLAGSRIYDDHHNYTAGDVNVLYADAARSGAKMLLTTEKDYNKIGLTDAQSDLVLAYLAVKLQFISGQDQITQLIERSLAGKIRGK